MSGSSQLLFYLARVNQARAEADSATLEHVRQRFIRSEEAWQALALRAQRSEIAREKLAAEKSGVLRL